MGFKDKLYKLIGKEVKFDYMAHIYIPNVDSMRRQLSVRTILKRDADDSLLYLIDVATKGKRFKELFPGDNPTTFSNESLPELKKTLENLKKKKLTDSKKKESAINPLNIEKNIYQIEYLISQYEQGKGSFVIEQATGIKEIYYQRKSSGLFPMKFDINSNKAFSPTEKQAKDAFMLWRTKHENLNKNPTAHIEKMTATIASVILICMVFGGGFGLFKLYTHNAALDASYVAMEHRCADDAIKNFELVNKQNAETSGLLNDFIKSKVLEPEPVLEKPKQESIK